MPKDNSFDKTNEFDRGGSFRKNNNTNFHYDDLSNIEDRGEPKKTLRNFY